MLRTKSFAAQNILNDLHPLVSHAPIFGVHKKHSVWGLQRELEHIGALSFIVCGTSAHSLQIYQTQGLVGFGGRVEQEMALQFEPTLFPRSIVLTALEHEAFFHDFFLS